MYFNGETSLTIPPRKSDSSFYIYFSPAKPGNDSAMLIIKSLAGDSTSIKLLGHSSGLPFFSNMNLLLYVNNLRIEDAINQDTTFFNDSLLVSGNGYYTDSLITFNYLESIGSSGPPPYSTENKYAQLQIHFTLTNQRVKSANFSFDDYNFTQSGLLAGETHAHDYQYNFTLVDVPFISYTDSTFGLDLTGEKLLNSFTFYSSTSDNNGPNQTTDKYETPLFPLTGARVKIFIKH